MRRGVLADQVGELIIISRHSIRRSTVWTRRAPRGE